MLWVEIETTIPKSLTEALTNLLSELAASPGHMTLLLSQESEIRSCRQPNTHDTMHANFRQPHTYGCALATIQAMEPIVVTTWKHILPKVGIELTTPASCSYQFRYQGSWFKKEEDSTYSIFTIHSLHINSLSSIPIWRSLYQDNFSHGKLHHISMCIYT